MRNTRMLADYSSIHKLLPHNKEHQNTGHTNTSATKLNTKQELTALRVTHCTLAHASIVVKWQKIMTTVNTFCYIQLELYNLSHSMEQCCFCSYKLTPGLMTHHTKTTMKSIVYTQTCKHTYTHRLSKFLELQMCASKRANVCAYECV